MPEAWQELRTPQWKQDQVNSSRLAVHDLKGDVLFFEELLRYARLADAAYLPDEERSIDLGGLDRSGASMAQIALQSAALALILNQNAGGRRFRWRKRFFGGEHRPGRQLIMCRSSAASSANNYVPIFSGKQRNYRECRKRCEIYKLKMELAGRGREVSYDVDEYDDVYSAYVDAKIEKDESDADGERILSFFGKQDGRKGGGKKSKGRPKRPGGNGEKRKRLDDDAEDVNMVENMEKGRPVLEKMGIAVDYGKNRMRWPDRDWHAIKALLVEEVNNVDVQWRRTTSWMKEYEDPSQQDAVGLDAGGLESSKISGTEKETKAKSKHVKFVGACTDENSSIKMRKLTTPMLRKMIRQAEDVVSGRNKMLRMARTCEKGKPVRKIWELFVGEGRTSKFPDKMNGVESRVFSIQNGWNLKDKDCQKKFMELPQREELDEILMEQLIKSRIENHKNVLMFMREVFLEQYQNAREATLAEQSVEVEDLMAAVPVVDKMLAGEEVDERKDMVHAGNEQADAQKTKGHPGHWSSSWSADNKTEKGLLQASIYVPGQDVFHPELPEQDDVDIEELDAECEPEEPGEADARPEVQENMLPGIVVPLLCSHVRWELEDELERQRQVTAGKVVLVVRGTQTLADCLTDCLCDGQSLGSGGLAHRGAAAAAEWLVAEYGEALRFLEERGYEVVLVGHSLGAAVAASCAVQLRSQGGGLRVSGAFASRPLLRWTPAPHWTAKVT
ncbi:unnamed protein product [Effrenium voratum]|nr:unnamed protein product [Effrenium voratum]